MNLVFLGPAGSGKGTQAKKLEAEYGVAQISTGDLLREAVRNGTELGRQADPLMKQGKLVPDDLVIGIIEERFRQGGLEKGILLDGFPRTVPQAEALDAMLERNGIDLDKVISLEVPDELLYERITGRRSCPKCGTVYHLSAAPPKQPGVCDLDGTALIQRSDDTPEKLANRLEVFKTEIPKVKQHYASKGLLSVVDGVGSPDAIFSSIRRALGA
ncbi:adenylate kinase [Vulgatibacter incomptus]|uniref:Adenylate kinase n=1 Tax=Vulgatibacter incomptus TaxID=1391653 RepID=A0A0K1PDF0_9BACT|nr:adenylate kinase [Vulgatibacter incomptus]AKU91568.1 Adenylate kinase [Vulgatibacter incomptus]